MIMRPGGLGFVEEILYNPNQINNVIFILKSNKFLFPLLLVATRKFKGKLKERTDLLTA